MVIKMNKFLYSPLCLIQRTDIIRIERFRFNEKKLSIAALSKQLPRLDMLIWAPTVGSMSW